ncbi:MAG: helix-turn-helix transcriptional regulator [Candidatus Zixiibacteriota bacterium]
MLTSEQIRAARMLLRWEQKDLADKSGVSLPTIKRIESRPGEVQSYASTVAALVAALEEAGIELIGPSATSAGQGAGVRLRS